MKRYGFILGVLLIVVLAALFPKGGAGPGYLYPDFLSKAGVCLIFFCQGLSLQPREIRKGALQWRLHAWIQGFIFILAPLLALALLLLFGKKSDPAIQAGFLFLGLLPTTITSAVAFVISSNGNVPGAIFNTSLSNVAGVFLTPLLASKALGAVGAEAPPAGPLLLKIGTLLILPLIAGQISRPWLAEFGSRHQSKIKKLTTGIVFFILYTAFSESFLNRTWSILAPVDLVKVVLLTLAYLMIQSGIIWWVTGKKFAVMTQEDRSAAFFCGSQKTLAAGAPMAAFIFSSQSSTDLSLSLFLLPLVIYHPCQLVLAAMMVPLLTRKVPSQEM